MSDDVARFLQQINERRAQEQARQAQQARAQAAAQKAQAPQALRQPTPAAPQSAPGNAATWQYTSVEPLTDVEILSDRPLQQPPRQAAQRSQQQNRPARPANAPPRREQSVSRPAPAVASIASPHAAPADAEKANPSKATPGAESLLAMLRSPAQLRNAFLLGEIFRRPEW